MHVGQMYSAPLSVTTGLLAATPTGSTSLFSLNGSIRLLSIIGTIKTTAMEGQQTELKLQAQSDALAVTDICAVLDVDADTVGTTYNITGTFANAMVATAAGVAIAQAGYIVIPVTASGLIILNNADVLNDGQTFWEMLYEPVTPHARATPLQ